MLQKMQILKIMVLLKMNYFQIFNKLYISYKNYSLKFILLIKSIINDGVISFVSNLL